MNYQDLRIVFMGTPEFAVASLDALVNAGCNIVGVITAPDKPAGRGMKLTESAVKKYAVEKNLPLLQPEKLKNEAFLQQLKALQADLQIVVAFRMLPEIVWNMPPMGTVNLHGSLLPQYRGAAPINWAVINGEKETGVTTFKLQHAIDTGNILLQKSFAIGEDETAGEVHDTMKIIGAEVLVETVKGLAAGSLEEQNQSSIVNRQSSVLQHAPKIFTETCKIDWNKSADDIHNLIRGLSPFPAAFTFLNDKMLKVYKSKKEITQHNHETGKVFTDNKTYLKYSCSNGFIHLLEIQLEGKKKMLVEDFLRGNKINYERQKREISNLELKIKLTKEYLDNGGYQKIWDIGLLEDLKLVKSGYDGKVDPDTVSTRVNAFMLTILASQLTPPFYSPNQISEYDTTLQKSNSFDQINIDTVDQFNKIYEEYKSKTTFLFRGQREAKWRLYGKLQRYWISEKLGLRFGSYQSLLEKMISLGRQEYKQKYIEFLGEEHEDADNDIAVLSFLQHHGCPTPLLDWTYKFQNALFFALDGLENEVRKKEIDDYFSVYFIEEKILKEAA